MKKHIKINPNINNNEHKPSSSQLANDKLVKELEQDVKSYDRMIKRHPDDDNGYYAEAGTLAKLGETTASQLYYNKALECYNHAIAIAPHNTLYVMDRSKLHLAMDRIELAAEDIKAIRTIQERGEISTGNAVTDMYIANGMKEVTETINKMSMNANTIIGTSINTDNNVNTYAEAEAKKKIEPEEQEKEGKVNLQENVKDTLRMRDNLDGLGDDKEAIKSHDPSKAGSIDYSFHSSLLHLPRIEDKMSMNTSTNIVMSTSTIRDPDTNMSAGKNRSKDIEANVSTDASTSGDINTDAYCNSSSVPVVPQAFPLINMLRHSNAVLRASQKMLLNKHKITNLVQTAAPSEENSNSSDQLIDLTVAEHKIEQNSNGNELDKSGIEAIDSSEQAINTNDSESSREENRQGRLDGKIEETESIELIGLAESM